MVGGLFYTMGVVVLIRQRPDPVPDVFGYHEVWHAFTVAAGACHFAFICSLAPPAPGPLRLPRGGAPLPGARRGLPLRLHLAAGHRRLTRPRGCPRGPGPKSRDRARVDPDVTAPAFGDPAPRSGDETPGGTMGQLAEGLLGLSGWTALAFLFVLPALEAPAFLGLVLPGEVALVLGGVLAAQDRIPLAAALAVGTAGALRGDAAGYWIGRRWGPRLLATRLGRRVGPARLHRVESPLPRGGGGALPVGRRTAGGRG